MRSFFTAALVTCLVGGAAAAEDVSREAPEVYVQHVAPLLTPCEQVLQLGTDFAGEGDSAVSLLYETVRWVKADGTSCEAIHTIAVARNDQGVAYLAKDVFPFRKSNEKIHLVMARSIQPDGSEQLVASNAAFLQSPQREADSSLYLDYHELVVLFPNVRINTIREAIVVVEEQESRIPDEFTGELHFSTSWPEARIRHVIDVDPAIAGRLKITPLGQGLPTPQRETTAGDRVRLTWQSERVPKIAWEPQRAPANQVGPVVFLSTLKDWDALGAWYAKLLQGRDRCRDALAQQVAASTKGLKKRDDIIAALLTQAAREVRYTGLEFGMSGLQPYDPNDVWANHYGDCKDKANLLRAMLREKKIASDLAFVNTNHCGQVEKRSPDYRYFNHVILAIPKAKGGYLFCDPTIKYAQPGMLRPDDADRDVLVLKDQGTEFVRTPAQDTGEIAYDFDLKRGKDGGLSGWMSVEAKGYQAASWAQYFSTANHEQLRERSLPLVQGFYRTAQLIDASASPIPAKWAGSYMVRVYFVVPGSGPSDGVRDTLSFPIGENLLPEFRESKSRQTAYCDQKVTSTVHCRIQLPSGWSAIDLPRPFEIAAAPMDGAARWEAHDSEAVATLRYQSRQSEVPPEQFPLLYNAVTSLRSWAARPLEIAKTGKVPTTAPALASTAVPLALDDFPLMSSGEGQLELVERNYPINRQRDLRREALQTVLQWFPDDVTTAFVANVRLVEINLNINPRDAASLDRMRRLIADAKEKLEANYVAWGDFALAVACANADQKHEAVEILVRLAGNAASPAVRRAWAAVHAAGLLKEDDPSRALAVLQPSLELDSPALPTQYAVLAELLLSQGKGEDLHQQVGSLVQKMPQQAGNIVSSLIDTADRDLASGHQATAAALIDVLAKVLDESPGLAQLRPALSAVRERVGAWALSRNIAGSLKAYMKEHRPDWMDRTPVEASVQTPEQFRRMIETLGKQIDGDAYCRYILEYLVRFEPESNDDYFQKLWGLIASMQSHDRDAAFVDQALAWFDTLPPSNLWYHEAKFVRASVLSRRGEDGAALGVLTPMTHAATAVPAQRVMAYCRIGEILERQKKYPEALAAYKELEHDLKGNRRACDAILHAVFINLEQGDQTEALRLCGLLAQLTDKDLDVLAAPLQTRDLINLGKDAASAKAFWQRQVQWWPAWAEIERQIGLTKIADEMIVPIIADEHALGQQLVAARRAGDKDRFFQSYRIVVYAARWDPRYAAQLASLLIDAAQMAPAQYPDLRKLTVQVLTDLRIADPQLDRPARIQLAANLIDEDRADDALDAIQQYRRRYKADDAIERAMHRVWALAAMRAHDAVDEIEKAEECDLAGDRVPDRVQTIQSLAELYHSAGQIQSEINLLEREMSNPQFKADAAVVEMFRKRHDLLVRPATQSIPLRDAVAHWLLDHKPGWYDFAEPHRLEDFKADDLDAAIKSPPKNLLTAEVAKLGLLIALAPDQSKERQRQAFALAVSSLGSLCLDDEQAAGLYRSLYDDKEFEPQLRQYWLYIASDLRLPQPNLATHELVAGLVPAFRKTFDAKVAFHRMDFDSATEIEAYLTTLLEKPLDSQEVGLLERGVQRLAQLELLVAARRVYNACEQVSVTSDSGQSAAAIRLVLLRFINEVSKFGPAENAVRDIVLKSVGDADIAAPAHWNTLGFRNDLSWLEIEKARAIRIQVLKTRRMLAGNMPLWSATVSDICAANRGDRSLGIAAFRSFIENLPDDASRGHLVAEINSYLDLDDPREREIALNAIDPYRDAKRYPATFAAIRYLDIHLAMRTGKPLDLDAELRTLPRSTTALMATRFKPPYYFLAGDMPALKQALQSLDPKALFEPATLSKVLPALKAADMPEEAEIAADAARKEIYRAVLHSWGDPNRADLLRVSSLAEVMELKDPYPKQWLIDFRVLVQNSETRDLLELKLASLQHDWPAVVTHCDRLIQKHPTLYDIYLYKGRALLELGRKAEGVDALQSFLDHCKDSMQFPAASRLLEEAGK